ncbi:hypothetical protein [uncultured Parasphingorhabdus sp.]|uniref:hypothetical protein n=1 Tax=uncultured Parasphingorhabdus sp. TaxID=2709694 RepID=UPI0030DD5219
MAGAVAGAPLRAFGTIISIWMMVRVIAWNIPSDIVIDSIEPVIGNSAIRYEVSQTDNAGVQRWTGSHFSKRVARPDNDGEKNDLLFPSYLSQGSIDQISEDRSIPKRYFLLASMQAVDVSYTLPAGTSLKHPPRISRGIGSNILPEQNLAAKQGGNGLQGYAWVFARQVSPRGEPQSRGGGSIISNGQYGGSQAGVILSYPILAKPDPEIAVYGRLTTALAPLAQEEAALGVRLRPVQALPFSIHAEKRLDADSGGDRGTAFYIAGGTGPDPIIENILLETYGQAGYVLGEYDSYFFDGSATLQRPVAGSGRKKLYFGAGVWAGGERKITRLDIGPRAEIRVPVGATSARLSVDWRVRVAGNARPENGLAITVSTGF